MREKILLCAVAFLISLFGILFFLNGDVDEVVLPDENPTSSEAVRISYGVIEHIDTREKSMIISRPDNYSQNKIIYVKVFFDADLTVVRRDLLQREGAIYSVGEGSESSLSSLKAKDKILFFYKEDQREERLHLLYIWHGNPFPAF